MSQTGNIRYAGHAHCAQMHECDALQKANPTAMLWIAKIMDDDTWSMIFFTEVLIECIVYCPFCGSLLEE